MISKFILSLIIVCIQFIFFDQIENRYLKINLVVITIVYFALKEGQMTGQILGFFFGFIQDTIQFQFLGLNMLSLTIIGFIIGNFKSKINVENYLVKFMIIFIAILLREFINYFNYFFILDTPISISLGIVFSLLINALFNGIISYIVFFILNKKFKEESKY